MNDATMNQQDAAFLEALEAAQQRIAAGAGPAEAIEGVPAELREDVAATLEALLHVEALAEGPSMAFGTTLEARFLDAVESARVRHVAARARAPRSWLGLTMLRTAAVLGAVVLALAGGGFAAVQAAETTIPGDTLYPVKEAGERVRVFFARGDGVTRLRLGQLTRRQAELEQALRRGDPARSVLALEVRVAAATDQLVNAARRLEAAGNPAPAEATLEAVTQLHDRIEVLVATEQRPAVARTLLRMSNYLEGQERVLSEGVPGNERLRPPAVVPTSNAPLEVVPTRTATPAATREPTSRPTATPLRQPVTTPAEIAPAATRTPEVRPIATATPAPTRATPIATSLRTP